MAEENEGEQDEPLTEAELETIGPVVAENATGIVIPKKGSVIAEDGTVKVAVIRPCQSRGRAIRGLQPIYEAAMLGRNAGVFKGWPMFMGHVPKGATEILSSANRDPSSLGGRLVETWYEPDMRQPHDDDFGYRPGATVARVIPQEAAEKIISRDADALQTSVWAWPTGVKPGKPSWGGPRGALIEGFRGQPVGSVDWVIRGGAGGQVLSESEAEARVISLLEEAYAFDAMKIDFKTATPAEVMEWLREENADLATKVEESLGKTSGQPPAAQPTGAVTLDQIKSVVAESQADTLAKVDEKLVAATERITEGLTEERDEVETARTHASLAESMIAEAEGLMPSQRLKLRADFKFDPSDISPTLLSEAETDASGAETKSDTEVFRAAVAEAIKTERKIVQEAQGLIDPEIREQGGSGGGKSRRVSKPAWQERMVDLGVVAEGDEAMEALTGAAPKRAKPKDDGEGKGDE